SDFIGDEAAGTIVRSSDPEAVATAARNLLENQEELSHKSANARKRVVDNFSITAEVEGIHKIYEGLWERR
ncbi:MAG: glycosyltransferase family 1 protein, partial [Pseudomonadota bacterium]